MTDEQLRGLRHRRPGVVLHVGQRGVYPATLEPAADAGHDVVLTEVRWTNDTTVSGTGTWDRDTGQIAATLTLTVPGSHSATVTVAYHDYEPDAVAVLTGTADGKRLAARTPAP